jgi:glycosyltransferase involved in cell wall biosynthesis
METLLVFSHLRWNFVYQRPQHLLSRLARRWRVVFVEEPMPGATEDRLEVIAPCADVTVWRPHLRNPAPGFHDDHLAVLQPMLRTAMQADGVKDYWTWFYTPMAYPLANGLRSRGIVYDCMDELSQFRNAPRQLLQRETALLKAADLVFTGGPSLYRAKRDRHPDVHCFSSSVDAAHFASADADHPLQAQLPRPRLGWAGVIDERVNLELIAAVADARPKWQLVMVGPIVKIDPASVPQRPNIHWLGQQAYEDLPRFISSWDVCILPFALNEATRFISPTKILEYMACGRPSVSTSIRDVVDPYGHLVPIADEPRAFIEACEATLARTPHQQFMHAKALAEVVAGTSWDRTADAMAALILRADEDNQGIRQAAQVLARQDAVAQARTRSAPVEAVATARVVAR